VTERVVVPVPVRVRGRDVLVGETWDGDDEVGLLTVGQQPVAVFADVDALGRAATDQGMATDPVTEAKRVDLDAATSEARSGREVLDCATLLGAWDLVEDLAEARGRPRPTGAVRARVHEKLFWGCNLPSVTPSGEQYVPSWSRRERRVLRRVTERGSALVAGLAGGAAS
jgi:hypothetical protein